MIFPFGKYKHKHINYVFLYLKDYEYIDWYINNIKNHNIPNNVIIYLNSIDNNIYLSRYKFGNPDIRFHNNSDIPVIDCHDYFDYYIDYLLTTKTN